MTISVGGEIGEVGKKNSTVEDLRAYLDGYRRELDARRPGAIGVSKVSVQTGTSHGGVAAARRRRRRGEARLQRPPGPRRGRPGRVRHRRRGAARREHPSRQPVPHASRRSRPPRSTWRPASRTRSTSTRPSRPTLHAEIEAWCFANAADERKAGMTDTPVRLHDPQEGDRPVQAPDLEPPDEGRDPGHPGRQARLPVRPAEGDRDGRPAGPLRRERARVAPPGARGPEGRRRGVLNVADATAYGPAWSAGLRRAGEGDLAAWLALALEMCDEADRLALRWYRRDVPTSRKPDRTFVTEADQAIERLIRDRVRADPPGPRLRRRGVRRRGRGAPGVRWYIDPIDGTHNFIRGVPLFGTLLGVEVEGEMQVGVMSRPGAGRALVRRARHRRLGRRPRRRAAADPGQRGRGPRRRPADLREPPRERRRRA